MLVCSVIVSVLLLSPSSSKYVPEPEDLEGSSRSEGLSKIVLAVPASERSFTNVNLLSASPSGPEVMSIVSSSRAKGCPGGRASTRLRVVSGKGLIEQRKAAAKAASSKPDLVDLTVPVKAGSKRKASARPEDVKVEDIPRKKEATVEGVGKIGAVGQSIADLFHAQDPALKSEVDDVSPLDCIGEAGCSAWKTFQYLLGAYSGVKTMVTKAEDRTARSESDLASLRTKLDGAESRCREIERRLTRELKSYQGELVAYQKDFEECRSGVEEEVKRARIADGQIAGDIGAFYAVKSRIEMIEEFNEGKHELWDLKAEKETLESMFPKGDPGQELFCLAGVGEDAVDEGADEGEAHPGDVDRLVR